MTILDLRSWPLRAWNRLSLGPGGGGVFARGATALADRLVEARVARRDPPSLRLFVVSVGNLALGGTGKTPVTAALARELAAAGHAGAVLTRGYGSSLPGPVVVQPGDGAAGDEARLLAAGVAASGWTVVQARDRREGLRLLERMLPAGAVVILEDGHQTARVGRHLDVLILDRWTGSDALEPVTGPVAPFGPWRESARGARRAAVWLVESEGPPPGPGDGAAVAGFVRSLRLTGTGGEALSPAGPWAALSGIARPERFEDGVASLWGGPPALAIRCVDHEPYGRARLARITDALRAAGAPVAVTTEKDWTKLAGRWPADLPVALARLDLRWTGERALPALVGERLAAAGMGGPASPGPPRR